MAVRQYSGVDTGLHKTSHTAYRRLTPRWHHQDSRFRKERTPEIFPMAHHTRYALPAAFLALGLWCAAAPVQAAPQATVIIQSDAPNRDYRPGPPAYQVIPAPPPPRHEAMPHPRRGHVWQAGHWEWRGNRHRWVPGHWVQARPGYRYRQPQWEQHNGRWEMQRGGWDRDGDGIPNRRDRDRDGDGVPNRYDERPDNPYRR